MTLFWSLRICFWRSSEFERWTAQMPTAIAATAATALSATAGIARRCRSGTTFGRSARAAAKIRCSRVSGGGGRSTS